MINEIKHLIEKDIEFCHKSRRVYLYKITDKEYLILKFDQDGELSKKVIPEEKFTKVDEAISRWLELVGLSPAVIEKKKRK